ncbi:hypothetical protein JI747_014745 [Chryseobacterium sp. RG1]|uniref:Uncharacterized protein n=1 Tax=Chryseobacterium tagetis TaxID=2801334 RepID=A0ABS8A371_9FLAO|nr:hypothetical protein [Chryseobacterium tagetis]MCA6068441.1 hypothetical protein [Chryseobacterium tagetis]
MDYFIYSLEHIYTDETHRDAKFIGFFDDIQELEKVKQKFLLLSGFSEYPNDFYIKKYELNKIHWQNGFTEVVGEIGRDYLPEEDCVPNYSYIIKKINQETVFKVSHTYTIHTFLDDEREIGIFSDKKMANDVIDFLKQKEGFKKHPDDFIIDEIVLNDQHWCSGFG